MTEATTGQDRLTTVVRWVARAWSIPSIAALLLPSIVEGPYWLNELPTRSTPDHTA